MKNEVCNITFGGVGGQGVLKASEICGVAAMLAGFHVKKSEVHGMAQRGGSVESHVRFGRKVYSPLVVTGGADYLVCFHKEEHERLKPFLKAFGTDLIGYLDKTEGVLNDARQLNVFLVGVLSARLGIKEEYWLEAIEMSFKPKFIEDNKRIFLKGREMAQS